MSLKTEQPERDNPPEHILICTALKSFLDDARGISGNQGLEHAALRGATLVRQAQSAWISHLCDLVDVNQERLVELLRKTVEERIAYLKTRRRKP